jgi:hypothetical protein
LHPSEDVQIEALRSLKRLGDKLAVPFLLVYAESQAVYEVGSENATIHGIIHETIAEVISDLTGIRLSVKGQAAEKLRQGVLVWRNWLMKQQQRRAT